MITISLCMIVKNEEKVLARCLDSVNDLVDEIIIVDTGSTDNTLEIARSYTDKIFSFEWVDNFSVARNFSFSKANMEYILWLDADDVLLEEDRKRFKQLKSNIGMKTDIVMMKYIAGFDDYGTPALSYYRERLLKRSNGYRWHEPVHEHLDIWGNILDSDICVTHKKDVIEINNRNLEIYESNLRKGVDLSPRGLYYYARELYNHQKFDDAIEYFIKFIEIKDGWVEDKIATCFNLANCYSFKKEHQKALEVLIKSFQYDTPRAEICCLIGYYYLEFEDYNRSIVWYKLASSLEKPKNSWGFILHDYWDYIPNIQLCLCYDRLGEFSIASYYNEKASEFKPQEAAVLNNREYFKLKGVYK